MDAQNGVGGGKAPASEGGRYGHLESINAEFEGIVDSAGIGARRLAMTRAFAAILEKEAGGGYDVYCPTLPGCHTQSETIEEGVGLETARILINSTNPSEGYTALWNRGRLDLTVEAVIYDNSKWHPLFTTAELAICKERLIKYEYFKT
jgi:hypothetical protein